MALAPMKKVMIVSHHSEAEQVLEAIQKAGIVQILDAERSLVSKEWPELEADFRRPKELEEMVSRLKAAISFLGPMAPKSDTSIFAPLKKVDATTYNNVITGDAATTLLADVEGSIKAVEKLKSEQESINNELFRLTPWKGLSTPIEELFSMSSTSCIAGLVPGQAFEEAKVALTELGAIVEHVGAYGKNEVVLVFAMKDKIIDAQKALRGVDFEPADLHGLKGTIAENEQRLQTRLKAIHGELAIAEQKAADLANKILDLKILFDHYQNLLNRKLAQEAAPATDHVVFFEGWLMEKDFAKLEKAMSKFDSTSLIEIEPGMDEEPPIEIENNAAARPFEVITRLYGMPSHVDVDPTALLAPFFALFFGLCMTDAGYGLVIVALLAWVLRKMQGNKTAIWMLLICGITTIAAGVVTGSWFSDTITAFAGEGSTLDNMRKSVMLFDPMKQPLIFIGISLALGYIQIMFGLIVSFIHLMKRKQIVEAVCEKLVWIVMLASIGIFAGSKAGVLPGFLSPIAVVGMIASAITIFLFTERNSGLAGRLGGGGYALFSTVFYMGDMLSYVRIMALGMVGAGLGMAVNILAKLLMDIPYAGFILGMLMFVVGHMVNIVLSLLSAFVHTLRLQFVEFFPKFFQGGGYEFKPLKKQYQHVAVDEE